jgi:hypothetical protein
VPTATTDCNLFSTSVPNHISGGDWVSPTGGGGSLDNLTDTFNVILQSGDMIYLDFPFSVICETTVLNLPLNLNRPLTLMCKNSILNLVDYSMLNLGDTNGLFPYHAEICFLEGCTDEEATNYNSDAERNQTDSCEYATTTTPPPPPPTECTYPTIHWEPEQSGAIIQSKDSGMRVPEAFCKKYAESMEIVFGDTLATTTSESPLGCWVLQEENKETVFWNNDGVGDCSPTKLCVKVTHESTGYDDTGEEVSRADCQLFAAAIVQVLQGAYKPKSETIFDVGQDIADRPIGCYLGLDDQQIFWNENDRTDEATNKCAVLPTDDKAGVTAICFYNVANAVNGFETCGGTDLQLGGLNCEDEEIPRRDQNTRSGRCAPSTKPATPPITTSGCCLHWANEFNELSYDSTCYDNKTLQQCSETYGSAMDEFRSSLTLVIDEERILNGCLELWPECAGEHDKGYRAVYKDGECKDLLRVKIDTYACQQGVDVDVYNFSSVSSTMTTATTFTSTTTPNNPPTTNPPTNNPPTNNPPTSTSIEEVRSSFNTLDTNNDGFLNPKESGLSNKDFQRYDTNSDGLLSRAEVFPKPKKKTLKWVLVGSGSAVVTALGMFGFWKWYKSRELIGSNNGMSF